MAHYSRFFAVGAAVIVALLMLLAGLTLSAAASAADDSMAGLSREAEALKQDVVDLNRELLSLQEDLLYPLDTQVVFFLGVADDAPFTIESVELVVDDKVATSYLYSDREAQALKRGGVQRLHVGNLAAGTHKVQAIFNGRGTDDKFFRSTAKLQFAKRADAKYLELRVEQRPGQPGSPVFRIEELR